jgi:hypothetical protein
VENIFWRTGTAPRGNYSVNVNQYSNCASGNANWTLTVRVGGAVVMQQSGSGGSSNFNFSY